MNRRRRLPAQALAETAVVMPVFMMIVLLFFQMGTWVFNQSVALPHALREGVRAGNEAFGAANDVFGRDPRITTAFTPGTYNRVWKDTPNACRQKAVNTSDATYASRLGWDWGCLPGSRALVQAALDAAVAGAGRALATSWLGPAGTASIQACYLTVDARGTARSVLCSGTGPGPTAGLSNTRTAAPAFLRVTISAPALPWLWGSASLTLRGADMAALDRLLPACPLTDRTPAFGTCGWN